VGLLTNIFRRRSTDDRLLSGELSPDSDAAKARAEQLTSPHNRELIAKELRDLVEEAQKPMASLFNANLRIQRPAIRESQPLILTLARELEELAVVNPRGVILADRLVRDGGSPVYSMVDHGQINRAVERAREELKAD
jgi:hypothetical protein